MIDTAAAAFRTTVRLADAADREHIYRARHEVYAVELGQHPVNRAGRLTDALDAYNRYIVATAGDRLLGFVSITPPPPHGASLSIDKYVSRDALPFAIDASVYEVRLLTVLGDHRSTQTAGLLMWAAMRYVESCGGRRVVGIGRRQVMAMYRKAGLEPTGVVVGSGRVEYELMHADLSRTDAVRRRYAAAIGRARSRIDWRFDFPFDTAAPTDLPAEAPPAPCYHGGAFFDAIGDRFDNLARADRIINADVLDAWFDPAPNVIDALRNRLPWLLRTSPPTGCDGLIAAIAEARGIDPACVLPGAGSSDLIFLALRQWLTPASRVLILDPTYGEYAHVLEHVVGCRVDRFTLDPADDYDPDPAALAARLRDGYDLCVIVNPNSPTGRHLRRDALEAVLRHAPRRTRCWVDETYIEYVGSDRSLEPVAASSDNVVVCKSMSKVYALSGARAAYLVGPRRLIATLRGLTPPWAVGLPGQVAAVEALRAPAYYAERYADTHRLRATLEHGLAAAIPGVRLVPGVANFVLAHLPPTGPTAAALVAACRRRDLFIRDAAAMGRNLGDRAIRIAVKEEPTTRRMLSIFADAYAAAASA